MTKIQRATFFMLGILVGLFFIAFAPLAFAADATLESTKVNVGPFASFLGEYVIPALGTVVGAALAYLANLVKAKLHLDIDAKQRDALQTALTNAAGLLVQKGVIALSDKEIDVGNPLIKAGIDYVQNAAPGALKHFGLGPEDIAVKIAAKLPMIPAQPTV